MRDDSGFRGLPGAGARTRVLSPQAGRFLRETAESAFPAAGLHDEGVAAEFLRRARRPRPTRSMPEPVDGILNERLPSGIRIRLYRPTRSQPMPVLLYFHGGGWVMGDLDSNDPLCRRLANEAGVMVASVDYRLAPEHPYPAALDDAAEALSWIANEGHRFGADATRLALAGSSAGGNLAAALALRLHAEDDPLRPPLALLYPPLDSRCVTQSFDENAVGYSLSGDQMRWFWRSYAPRQLENPEVAPHFAQELAGLGPVHIVVAGFDPLRDEGLAFADRLRIAGVEVTVDHREDQIHGFLNMVGLWPDADATASGVAARLRTELHDEKQSEEGVATSE